MDTSKWMAVKENDAQADGKFYYGVRTTGIFCLPSCKSKLPLKHNIVFFDTCDQAINEGFRPCKRCRPDLFSTYAPNEMLLCEIKHYLDNNFSNPHCLNGLDKRFSMSSFHISRIYKARFGVTPVEHIRNKRLEAAGELLKAKEMSILDIAFCSGFSSYTTFYSNFKNSYGMTPEEYRKGEQL